MKGMLVTMDPGKKKAGMALFKDGVLRACEDFWGSYSDGPYPDEVATALEGVKLIDEWWSPAGEKRFVYEEMQTRKGRADAHADLISLSIMTGGVAGYAASVGFEVSSVFPNQWTGSFPKRVHQKRTRDALEGEELEVLEKALQAATASSKSEILDAVGIGLFVLGRV